MNFPRFVYNANIVYEIFDERKKKLDIAIVAFSFHK